MTTIYTRHGESVDLVTPDPTSINPADIAAALAAICRFSGHTRVFYSVAEHSLMVSRMVPRQWRLRALLHDATEAYLQDVPTPLKEMLPEYRVIEDRLWEAIAQRFGLPAHDPEADAAIKLADKMALHVEMRDLFREHPGRRRLPAPPSDFFIPPQPLTTHEARAHFTAALNLMGRREESEQSPIRPTPCRPNLQPVS